jgi:hypothetical protein
MVCQADLYQLVEEDPDKWRGIRWFWQDKAKYPCFKTFFESFIARHKEDFEKFPGGLVGDPKSASKSEQQARNGYGLRTTPLPAPVNSAGPDQMHVLRAAPIVSVIRTEPEAMELLHDSVHLFEPTATDTGITNIAALGNIKSGKTTTVSTLFALQDRMHRFSSGAGGHVQNRNTFLASYKVRAKLSAPGVNQFGQHTEADLMAMTALNDCNLAEPCAPLLLLGDNQSPFAALPFTDCDGEGITKFFLGLNADPTTLTRLVLDDCDSVAMVQRPAPTALDPYATVDVIGGAMQHQPFRDQCFRGRSHDDKAQVVFCAHFSSDFTAHMGWEDWQIHTWIVAFDKDKPTEAHLETVIGKKDEPGTLFHEQVFKRYGPPGCDRFLTFLATEVEKHDALIIFGKAPTAQHYLNAWPGFALVKHTVTKSRADQIKAKKTASASFDTLRMLHTVGPRLWDENVHKKARFCSALDDDDCD